MQSKTLDDDDIDEGSIPSPSPSLSGGEEEAKSDGSRRNGNGSNSGGLVGMPASLSAFVDRTVLAHCVQVRFTIPKNHHLSSF